MTKYCDLYYTTRKTSKGYYWTIWFSAGKKMQSSLDSEDEDERYFKTKLAAILDAKDHIEED